MPIFLLQGNLPRLRKGGEGSGNFGHAGRPGEVGGSGEDGDAGDLKISPKSIQGKDLPIKVNLSSSQEEPELNQYEQNLKSIHAKATSKGIAAYDRKSAEQYGSQAAATINSQRSSGYTVYGSTLSEFDGTTTKLGDYAAVGYGAGESPAKVRQMVGILNSNGYNAMPTSEGVIIVSHPSWK